MAFLAIDVGNTQTTIGLIDSKGTVERQWRMTTDTTNTPDELRERLLGFFHMDAVTTSGITAAAVASVVPLLTRGWESVLSYLTSTDALVIDSSRDCGIRVAMDPSVSVGADRIANALAAHITYGAPVIVVDFGTATNIDVIDASGAFRGGVIMPGVITSANALFAHAAKLASVPLVAPSAALGDSTETAVQSGIIIGTACAAEGLVARISAELAAETVGMTGTQSPPPSSAQKLSTAKPTVVGTGGLVGTIAETTDLFDVLDPDLTLRGIFHIWMHARKKR